MTEYIVHSGKDVSSLIIGEDGGVTPVPFVVTPRPDHLPECGAIDGSMFCICAALRACEQRMLDAAREAVLALTHYRALECDPGILPGKRDDPDVWLRGYLVDSDDAIAAIDALRLPAKP